MSAVPVLIGLVAGLLVGAGASISQSSAAGWLVGAIEPVGTIFVNAIRMTVVPLVVASLIVGVGSTGDTRALTRLGARTVLLFVILAAGAATFATLVAAPLLARLEFDAATTDALRQSAKLSIAGGAETAKKIPGVAQWFVDLVPSNPIRSAADGAMLPLIVFTLGFGMALTKLGPELRDPVIAFFRGLAAAMVTLVRWVLAAAPVGVFALAVPLAARMGLAAAGALLVYVVLAVVLTVAFVVLILYPLTTFAGRISLRRFAQAVAPAQVVAFSSRSTIATLPAMIEAARRLALPADVTGFVVPLAASIFRVGSAVGQTVGVLFAGQLYGATPTLAQLITIIVTVTLTTFTVPGIPGGSIVVMVPILLAANLPVEGIGVLLGVDTIPDMFRTTANVTGGIAAAAIVGRSSTSQEVS